MKQYVNPVPTLEAGKEFEMRLQLSFGELTELNTAKQSCAEYILALSKDELAGLIHCTNIKTLYPKDLTEQELKSLGIKPDGGQP